MAADPASLSAIVEEVARFRIRDRAMLRAQNEMARALANGQPDPAAVARYLAAAEKYFAGFEREARGRLGDIDRRLAKAAQLQFNLTAERGVAAKRVEIAQGVLAHARELAQK